MIDKETNGHLLYGRHVLNRIANALEEVLRLVKEDQERTKKYMDVTCPGLTKNSERWHA